MRGNPSGNFVPECEPRKGVSWRLTELDAKSDREDSAGSSDTPSLVLGSIFYTKPPGFAQGGNQQSYLKWTTGIWGLRPFGAQDGFGRGADCDRKPLLLEGFRLRHCLSSGF